MRLPQRRAGSAGCIGMIINFACSQCAMPFKVNSKHAGRTGRCKGCGNRMTIPAAPAADVARTGRFRLGDQPAAQDAGLSPSMQLAAISEDLKPLKPKKAAPVAAAEPTSYKLAPILKPSPQQQRAHNRAKPAGKLKRAYQKQITNLSSLLGWLANLCLLLTFPCIFLFLLGILLRNWNFVLYGTTGVCIFSAARILLIITHLAFIPFRVSLQEGLLFLIPPVTLYFIYKYWPQMRKSAAGLVAPIFLVIALFFAFEYIPYLAGQHREGDSSIPGRIELKLDETSRSIKNEL